MAFLPQFMHFTWTLLCRSLSLPLPHSLSFALSLSLCLCRDQSIGGCASQRRKMIYIKREIFAAGRFASSNFNCESNCARPTFCCNRRSGRVPASPRSDQTGPGHARPDQTSPSRARPGPGTVLSNCIMFKSRRSLASLSSQSQLTLRYE